MIRFLCITGALLLGNIPGFADTRDSTGRSTGRKFFAGTNVFAPLSSFLPTPGNTLFSMLSNLECGATLSGGYFIRRDHALELRLAFGPSSRSERIFNTQVFYNWYYTRSWNRRLRGAYAGPGVRYWDLYHDLTGVHRHTLAGEIDLGYRFSIGKRFFLDLRFNEIIAAYSWLSEEHTTGGWATLFGKSLPRAPLMSLDFGVGW